MTDYADQARRALALAVEAARNLRHDFLGTEHLLLGLIEEGSSVAADVLGALGATPPKVRAAVERLVTPGAGAIVAGEIRKTPRARQALEFAADEARQACQTLIDAEHILLGLLREGEGVGGQVLRELGVELDAVRREVLKIRVLQMRIVERAVRPVRMPLARKRKLREELLAHLTAIFDEVRADGSDPMAAVRTAAKRFGDPAELARELDQAVPCWERLAYYSERMVAWRAPETIARYAWRLGKLTFFVLVPACCLTLLLVAMFMGWGEGARLLLRVIAAMLATAPPAMFMTTVLTLRMRNAMWGAFGSRRSAAAMWGYQLGIAGASGLFVVAFSGLVHGEFAKAVELWPSCTAAVLAAMSCAWLGARFNGPEDIRDARWALLDLATPELEG